MKRIIGIAVVALGLLSAGTNASAQEGFTATTMDVGPVIGFGGISGGGVSIGGRFERGLRDVGTSGILGLQVAVDYYQYDFLFTDDRITVLPVSVLVNYHFKFPNQPKLDVFAGAGIGYQRVSFDFDCGPLINCDFSDSGVFAVGHGGIRYFWQPKMALYADIVGNGAGAINVGIMFKLD